MRKHVILESIGIVTLLIEYIWKFYTVVLQQVKGFLDERRIFEFKFVGDDNDIVKELAQVIVEGDGGMRIAEILIHVLKRPKWITLFCKKTCGDGISSIFETRYIAITFQFVKTEGLD